MVLLPLSTTYLTDETLQTWQSSGKQAIVSLVVRRIEEGDVSTASAVFQELLKAAITGQLDATEAGSTVQNILSESAEAEALDLPALFLDQFSEIHDEEIRTRQSIRPLLRAFLITTNISPSLMRELLGSETLGCLGLTRHNFQGMTVRHSTNVLYRQSAFNLLREETEGYSKLITEYFTAAETTAESTELPWAWVTETWERVKALIGAFNMDPGRVLDVTLDVFANLLIRRNVFFIKLLRASSWWPQQRRVEGVKVEHDSVPALPFWAEPGSDSSRYTYEEQEQVETLKRQRDEQFWSRVREKGIAAYLELGGHRILSGKDKVQEQLSRAQEARSKEEEIEDMEIKAAESDKRREVLVRAKEDKAKEYMKAVEDLVWITTTNTFPASGNRTAAQILGFKLRFYASSARDKGDVLHDNVIYLAALLVKIGFISLRDLYPHLYPYDEDMPATREKLEKEKEERDRKNRAGGTDNALTRSAPLFDDTLQVPTRLREPESRGTPSRSDPATDKASIPPKMEAEEKESLPEPADQKISLLKSLLLIGAIPESLYILSRFPWLLDLHPDLPRYVNRLLRHSLGKLYENTKSVPDEDELRSRKQVPAEIQTNDIKTKITPPKKSLKWAQLENPGAEIDYSFYWMDWADHVPVCQTVDDVFLLCGTLLNLVGVKIGQDAELLTMLIRIGRKSLGTDPTERNRSRWIDLSKRLLFPALSFTKDNPNVDTEMHRLLREFPLETRYNIYAECYTGQTSRLPAMKAAFDQAKAETKAALKRINKKNTKQMARALAKPVCANPGIVFQVALNQLESYQNLIDCFVECGKYFSDLGYEVLVWSLLTALGGAGRNRMQADGMLTSTWLKALSAFTGRIFQKYSAMKIDPLLQYLASQLQKENSTDLEILQETLLSMGGIISDTTYGEDQVLALAGGPLLRDQTLKGLLDNRHGSRSSARRLMDALMRTNLAAPILILIAQERQLYAHRDSISDAPLKVLGSNLDKIHRAFVQYLEFLRSNMSPKDFDNIVPNIGRLVADFDLDTHIAFEICRPSIRARLTSDPSKAPPKEGKQDTPAPEKDLTDVDVPMLDAGTETNSREVRTNGTIAEPSSVGPVAAETNSANGKSLNIPDSEDVTMEDIAQPVATPAADTDTQTARGSPPVLTEIIEQLRSALPEETTRSISMLFFLRFWSMSLYDVTVPSQGYSTASQDITARVKKIQADRKDLSVSATKKREEEKAMLLDLQAKIQTEFKRHIEDHKTARVVLSRETDKWFADFPSYEQEDDPLSTAIITHCFLPRLSFSAMDAKFVAKFIFEVHSLGTRGFRTSRILDCMLREKKLANFLIQCTETEAENMGIFLNDVLYKLRSWHQSKEQYEKEAWGKKHNFPGFAKECNEDKSPKSLISYEDFRRDLFKWHGSIHAALKACLTSGDDTHIRNAIKCLMNMRKEFPAITFHGKQTLDTISALAEKETREDLKRMTQMAQGGLKQMEKKWVMPQAFRLSEGTGQKEPEISNRSSSTQPGTPQSTVPAASVGKTLDTNAPEFQPKLSQVNGVAPTTASDKMEVEDGEVEDEARKADLPGEATTSTQGLAPLASQAHGPQGQPEKDSERISKTPEPRSRTPQPAAQTQTRAESKAPSGGATPAEPKPLSRPGTPASSTATTQRSMPVQSSGPHRLEPSRPSPSQYPPRSTHTLPSRPEVDIPRERISHRVGDRAPNYPRHPLPQDARRAMADGRLDRPDDFSRVSGRGRGRDRSPSHLSRQRTPERLISSTHDNREVGRETSTRDPTFTEGRFSRLQPRETRSTTNLRSEGRITEPIQPPRDRFNGGPRIDEPAKRDSNTVAAPSEPSQAIPHGQDRGPPTNAERTSLMQGRDRSDKPIPESDRLVDREIRRPDTGRERDPHQRPSRSHSPLRRGDDQSAQTHRPEQTHDQQRDSRGPPSDRAPPPVHPSSRDRYPESNLPPPSGPRGGRVPRPGPSDVNSRPRDSLQPARTVGENAQSLHPERDFAVPSRPQDQGYTPANAPPDIPSGPRGRGRGRNPSRDFRSQETMPPSLPNTDRQPFSRHSRRPSDPPQTLPQSVPQSPAAERNAPDTADVHPSRLAQIEGRPPRTEVPSGPANLAPSSAPSGPRGTRPSSGPNFPIPSPTGRNPPSGPMSTTERRQHDDRRLANIQNTLAQASANPPFGNDRGSPNRGRGSNTGPPTPQNATASQAPPPGPQTPSGKADDPPVRPDPPSRRESLRSRAGLEGSDDRPDSRNSRRGEESGRSSRRQRSMSPRRDERTTDFRQRDSERATRGPPPSDASKERDVIRENENGDGDRDSREGRRAVRPREDPRERDRDRTRERDHGRELRDRDGRRDTRGPPHPSGPSRDDAHRNGAPLPPSRFVPPLPHNLHGGPPLPPMHHGRHMQWDNRGPPGPAPLPPMSDPMRNGELRTPRGGIGGDRDRRDERDDRGRGGMGVGRDSSGRKRGRGPPGPDEGSPVESKRPRRGGT